MNSKPDCECRSYVPSGPINLYAHYIGPNPAVPFNEKSVAPNIDPTSFVGPFSSVIGDVTIEKNCFIAPNVSIRADKGFPFFIGQCTNLQDGAILHGLLKGRVCVDGKEYSIHIGRNVSCTHGCIVHGPCRLGNNVFVGFNAIILDAVVGEGSYISTKAYVTGGVRIAPAGLCCRETLWTHRPRPTRWGLCRRAARNLQKKCST